jgi:hypothetical protein
MDIGFEMGRLNSFGCVVITGEIPHLFIMDGIELLEGIPFFDDNVLYTTLNKNELIIVGVSVKDSEGVNDFDVRMIDDDNYDELVYVVTPLKFYTIQTPGLTNDDMMDLGLFDTLINNLIDVYIENLYP